MVRAGQLRHRLAFKSLSQVQNETGEAIDTFTLYATLWGSVSPMTGRELENAQQIIGEKTHMVKIRYNSSVAITDRFTFDSRTFEVVHILDADERNIRMEIMAKEII